VISNVLIFILLVQPALSLASDSLEAIKYLPKGKACQVSGQPYRCFDLEECKLLLKFDQEFFVFERENEELKKINSDYEQIIIDKNQQLELQYDNYLIMSSERDRITDKWMVSDMELQSTKADKAWWRSVAFLGTGAGILVGVIGGFIIHSIISK